MAASRPACPARRGRTDARIYEYATVLHEVVPPRHLKYVTDPEGNILELQSWSRR